MTPAIAARFPGPRLAPFTSTEITTMPSTLTPVQDALGPRRGHVMCAHQTEAAGIQATAERFGLHPAQFMSAASAQHMNHVVAGRMLGVLESVRGLSAAGGGRTVDAPLKGELQVVAALNRERPRRDAMAPIERVRTTGMMEGLFQWYAGPVHKLEQEFNVAVKALDLGWARQLVTAMEREMASIGGSLTADQRQQLAQILSGAKLRLADETQLRGQALAGTPPESNWLSDASNNRRPTEVERTAVGNLLRQRGIDPSSLSSYAIDLFLGEVREVAKKENELFMREGQAPTDVLLGYRSRQDAVDSLSSSLNYLNHLGRDSEAFNKIASKTLLPGVEYARLATQAGNRGLLNEAQLRQIQQTPDSPMKTKLVAEAYRRFEVSIGGDFRGPDRVESKPTYGSFVNYLTSAEGRELFKAVWSGNGLYSQPAQLQYRANTLDFVSGIDRRIEAAKLADTPAARRVALESAKRDVEQQIALVEERGARLIDSSEPSLLIHAGQRLQAVKARVDRALAASN